MVSVLVCFSASRQVFGPSTYFDLGVSALVHQSKGEQSKMKDSVLYL